MERDQLKQIALSLHELEKKLLDFFKKNDIVEVNADSDELGQVMAQIEIFRASSWLVNKGLATEERQEEPIYLLNQVGKAYFDQAGKVKDLPEITLLKFIAANPSMTAKELVQESGLDKREYGFAFGHIKKNDLITIDGGKVSVSGTGQELLNKGISPEQQVLQKIGKIQQLSPASLSATEKKILMALKSRGLISDKDLKTVTIKLTDDGQKILEVLEDTRQVIDELTPEIIISGSWKGKIIRPYNITDRVPTAPMGKRHFVAQVQEYIRRIWTEMGFEEMNGPMVESAFWCFDALFTPQDHPAREMQDTFYMKTPAKARLPPAKIVDAVKKTHENGGDTGSLGWQYKWSKDVAQQVVLRVHTTSLSVRTLYQLNQEGRLPGKFFSVGRCFRNETMSWKHLLEFNQVDGIVVDPTVTFRHLLGYLKQFFGKLGFPKARFRPAFFPYTEPSVEIEVWHPEKKAWLELGGSGVFRPEVVKPILGKNIPVLAWGPGLDREVMSYYDIQDIRKVYSNELDFLSKTKLWKGE
ncbi:MAG: phenylalanine--tRNA ligase subunit alpha [Candidatus Odinarchaeota archaeon]